MRVACVGEAMVELSLDGSGAQAALGFAGDTLNTAIYLARAAEGLQVSYVTVLGQDAFSARLREYIAAEGIGTDSIQAHPVRNVGLYAITTDADGERSFTYWRDRSAARTLFGNGDFSALDGFDLIYLSAITLAILPDEVRTSLAEWLAGFRTRGGQVAFDSNYRPALWDSAEIARDRIAEFWRLTDIALPSVDDEMAVFSDATPEAVLDRMQGYSVTEGALKCGPEGPRSLGAPVSQAYPAAERVVDTTAAGDSFNGGYLAAHLSGASQADSLLAGHSLAARVVGVKGAIIPLVK